MCRHPAAYVTSSRGLTAGSRDLTIHKPGDGGFHVIIILHYPLNSS